MAYKDWKEGLKSKIRFALELIAIALALTLFLL